MNRERTAPSGGDRGRATNLMRQHTNPPTRGTPMGLFSRKADDALHANADAWNAARDAETSGQPVTAAAYQAQSDAAFQEWLRITAEEHNQQNGDGTDTPED